MVYLTLWLIFPTQKLIFAFFKSDEPPIQVHAVIGSVFAATAAIKYARSGHTQLSASNYSTYSTNTALVLSIFALIAAVVNFIRTSSASSIPFGLAFSALYLLSFVRLQAGQSYGYEISLLTSILLGALFLPRTREVVGRPLPREFCLLGVYGIVIFANAIHFWLGLGLALSFALLALSDDLSQLYSASREGSVTQHT